MTKTVLFTIVGVGALATLGAAVPIAAALQGPGGLARMHGFCGRGFRGFHAMNPEAAKDHLQVAAKWALRDVDASEEQQQKVAAIASGAVDDLMRLRQQHVTNREALHAQLGGAAIDRAALEEIRKSELALADEASKRFVRAMADAAEVLTPEQRQALVQRFDRFHHEER